MMTGRYTHRQPRPGVLIACNVGMHMIIVLTGLNNALAEPPSPRQPTRNVLLIHSGHPDSEYTRLQDVAIRSALSEPDLGPIVYHVEYLDLARREATPEYLDRLLSLFELKYAPAQIDLIITTDTRAVSFLAGPGRTLLPGTPLVFSGLIANQVDLRIIERPMTGVMENLDIGDTVRAATKILPNSSRLVVISDQSGSGVSIRALAKEAVPRAAPNIPTLWIDDLTVTEILDRAASFTSDEIVLLLELHDPEGRTYQHPDSALSRLCRISRAPIFACYDVFLGTGIVGGKLTSGSEQGRAAGKLAARVLRGEKAGAIPIVRESPNRYLFDYAAMQRWSILEDGLPNGSHVRFRPKNFFRTYRKYILPALAAIALQTAIIVALLVSRRRILAAERALREERDLLNSIMEFAPAGIMLFSDSGRLTYVNRCAADLVGETPSSLLGRRFDDPAWQLRNPDGRLRDPGEYLVSIAICTGASVLNRESELHRSDGTCRFLSVSGIPIKNDSGKLRYVLLMMDDATERHVAQQALVRSNEELEERVRERTSELMESNRALRVAIRERDNVALESRRRQDQLAHVQRVATMGEMATGLAHEINQPLAAITTYTQGCLRRLETSDADSAGLLGPLREIAGQAQRAAEIVRRLRAFVRKDRPALTSINVNQLALEATRMLSADAATHGIQVGLELADGVPTINADPIQFEQVLLNLIRNAMEAVSLRADEPKRVSVQTRWERPDRVHVEVRDNGPGISPEALNRLFEPFHTTKPDGLGMGLPISRSIIGSFGGRLDCIESAPGRTVFRIVVDAAALREQ
ncbi:MAG: PAS domain S-box protein [Phycisphaerae bacterium]|nr:PAS domain S-box protein [Phycisphaerae bacterium]